MQGVVVKYTILLAIITCYFFPLSAFRLLSSRYGFRRMRPESRMKGGQGEFAGGYSWREDELALEIDFPVPQEIIESEDDGVTCDFNSSYCRVFTKKTDMTLYEGTFYQKVNMRHSFWNYEPEECKVYFYAEKFFNTVEDWQNVFLEHDDHEKIRRDYEEPKPFNITQYIEKMGGYNESLVNKEMFATQEMKDTFFRELRRRGMMADIQDEEE